MQYSAANLLIKPSPGQPAENGSQVISSVKPQQAGWELIHFEVRRIAQNEGWGRETGEGELGLVVLGGVCSVSSNRGDWPHVGERANVFAGKAHALYLPRQTKFEVTARSADLEVAICWVPTDQDHPPRVVTPADGRVEIRGGHNATRQVNDVFPPGFDCHRLIGVEVYTPGGNWSSYPPHKHDVHREDAAGNLLEADLEEVYFYQIKQPKGFALQRVYTDDRALDATVVAYHNDLVLVPYGYHPVSAAYGYDCYYLNFLAGSAQSLANSDDPDLAWVKETWTAQDPRVPMV